MGARSSLPRWHVGVGLAVRWPIYFGWLSTVSSDSTFGWSRSWMLDLGVFTFTAAAFMWPEAFRCS